MDETARVFSTLTALDEADLKVLLHMTSVAEPTAWYLTRRHPNQTPPPLDEQLPDLAVVLDAVLNRLESLGLATSDFTPKAVGARGVMGTAFARLRVQELMREEDAGG